MTYYQMNPEREAHLERVMQEIQKRTEETYIEGQGEHGGDLWNKFTPREMVEQALEETIDNAVYLVTLLEMLDE